MLLSLSNQHLIELVCKQVSVLYPTNPRNWFTLAEPRSSEPGLLCFPKTSFEDDSLPTTPPHQVSAEIFKLQIRAPRYSFLNSETCRRWPGTHSNFTEINDNFLITVQICIVLLWFPSVHRYIKSHCYSEVTIPVHKEVKVYIKFISPGNNQPTSVLDIYVFQPLENWYLSSGPLWWPLL